MTERAKDARHALGPPLRTPLRFRPAVVVAVGTLVGLGCSSSTKGEGTDAGADANTGCDGADLVALCPAGTSPSVEIATCGTASGRETVDVGGTTTGVCEVESSCRLLCELAIPCLCGLDSLTADELTCRDCEIACGNSLCEPGEDQQNCELDCGARCETGDERCNGADREVCGVNGFWDRTACAGSDFCVRNGDESECRSCDVDDPPRWFVDRDGDTFGDPEGATFEGCRAPPRFVIDNTDCDDDDFFVQGGADCGVAPCSEGATRCGIDGLERCQGGTWMLVGCGATEICDDGDCRAVGGATTLCAGDGHACAIGTGDRVYCWGSDGRGQLGDSNAGTASATPIAVDGVTATQVGCGAEHTCAVTPSGGVTCWGANDEGQLGTPGPGDRQTPFDVGLTGVAEVRPGGSHTCARVAAPGYSDGIRCWGWNLFNQLGDGSITSSSSPVVTRFSLVANDDPNALDITDARQLTVGATHGCIATVSGMPLCFGSGAVGRLGTGNVERAEIAVPVEGLATVSLISAGGDHTCAVMNTSDVACWGLNQDLQLGVGPSPFEVRFEVVAGTFGTRTVTAGGRHTCALMSDASVLCWGSNGSGQLGRGSTGPAEQTPAAVTGLSGVTELAAGGAHTCARTDSGVVCWGDNTSLQLGTMGPSSASPVPVVIP